MRTCDDNDVIELAEGLLTGTRAAEVAAHVADCERCRRVLAELARNRESTAAAASRATTEPDEGAGGAGAGAGAPEVLPVELLERYLKKDAPERERAIAAINAGTALVGTLAILVVRIAVDTPEATRLGSDLLPWLVVWLACAGGLWASLRRGWFHRAVPLLATVLEALVFVGMQIALVRALGWQVALLNASTALWAAYVVLTAIRAEPKLCFLAGGLGAAYTVTAFAVLTAAGRPDVVAGEPPEAGAFHAVFVTLFFLVLGAGGAALTRHFRRQSERALRELRAQDLFGKYLLHEPLGTGGMGEVFRATYCPEGGFTKTVAVKSFAPNLSANAALRRRRSARRRGCARSLVHPNIVQVLDCGRLRGQLHAAMELVDGLSLASVLRRSGALDDEVVAFIGAELAAGARVHPRQVARRTAPRSTSRTATSTRRTCSLSKIGEVKLADFGVARALGPPRACRGRASSSGKLAYAAPEQSRWSRSSAADMFALGLTLHEALTGRRVFTSAEAIGVDAPLVSAARPDVSRELEAIVMELLARKPRDRPSAAQVRPRLAALAPSVMVRDALAAVVKKAVAAPPEPVRAAGGAPGAGTERRRRVRRGESRSPPRRSIEGRRRRAATWGEREDARGEGEEGRGKGKREEGRGKVEGEGGRLKGRSTRRRRRSAALLGRAQARNVSAETSDRAPARQSRASRSRRTHLAPTPPSAWRGARLGASTRPRGARGCHARPDDFLRSRSSPTSRAARPCSHARSHHRPRSRSRRARPPRTRSSRLALPPTGTARSRRRSAPRLAPRSTL